MLGINHKSWAKVAIFLQMNRRSVNGMFLAFLLGRVETIIMYRCSPPTAFTVFTAFPVWEWSNTMLGCCQAEGAIKTAFRVCILSALLCNFRLWLKCGNAGEMSKNNTL